MKKRACSLAFIVVALFLMLLATNGNATTISWNNATDNWWEMGLSTDPHVEGTLLAHNNGVTGPGTSSGSAILTPGVTYYLHLYVINWGAWEGSPGFMGDFTLSDNDFHFANGTQYLVTNTTDWFVSTIIFNWPNNVVTAYGKNGDAPWGLHQGIDLNAEWIWSNSFVNSSGAYISTPIHFDSSPVPEPSTLLLFGAGLVGLGAYRLKKRVKA